MTPAAGAVPGAPGADDALSAGVKTSPPRLIVKRPLEPPAKGSELPGVAQGSAPPPKEAKGSPVAGSGGPPRGDEKPPGAPGAGPNPGAGLKGAWSMSANVGSAPGLHCEPAKGVESRVICPYMEISGVSLVAVSHSATQASQAPSETPIRWRKRAASRPAGCRG